jgi:hypothetical protein
MPEIFPRIFDQARFPDWQDHYLALMAQRDLPNWGLAASPSLTERLFRMLAALHGQTWNASQVGKSLGLSYHPDADSLNKLRDTAALVGADHCVLISRTTSPVQGGKIASLNLAATLNLLLEGAGA